jgi:recombination protein RecT
MGTAIEVQDAPTTAVATQPEPMDQRTKQVMQLVGGDRSRAEKILRVAANAVQKVPALKQCDQGKLWMAILDVASMNLTFGPRGAYLVPYQSDVTVIVSPHGLIELAYRHPLVKAIQARVVREGEPFRIAYAPEPIVVHEPVIGGTVGELIGAYAIIDLTTGGRVVEWMPKADIMKAKAVSRAASSGSSPWAKWEEEMWRKTVLKRAMKYVPQSDDMQRAFEREDDDADFSVVEDTSAQVLAATTGTAALRDRVLSRKAAPEPVGVGADDGNP